ncbi:cuticle protein AM1159-like [Eriocheir sinensis]|uniref:cuticle protein AM1159-like n=1 Tax=Eriocheir sinensis TaxID=95602 RepID=UPI0021CA05F8|nr:cuticle protein AM1159-like [Eriocheir sinensis]
MKFVVLACLVAVAAAAPQLRPVEILLDERTQGTDGSFSYTYEAENGIAMDVSGRPGSEGQSNMQGSYRFTLPDGTLAEVRFFADENGYRAESPLIPPVPAHAQEQIRIAQEQREQGITFP